ncbi:MAG: PKD domain-containing protein [Bacteroidota bacterium]
MSKIYSLAFCILGLLLLHQNIFACSNCAHLSYIENKGQWESTIKYKSDIGNGSVFLESDRITFNLYDKNEFLYHRNHTHQIKNYTPKNKEVLNFFAYQIQFLNANKHAQVSNLNIEEAYYNFFIGSDKSKWASHVSGAKDIYYSELYKNIHLHISSENTSFKYEFICQEGANTNDIQLDFKGVEQFYVKNNKLYIISAFDTIIEQSPYAYQIINGKQKTVACKYQLEGSILHFIFPNDYDHSATLVIDPVVIFSTYSGSFADNFGYCATYDSRGNAYAGGSAFGNGYPVTLGSYQQTWAGGTGAGSLIGTDIAITKYSSNGRTRIYSTYLGGNSDEVPHSLIVNSNDELFILGSTSSTNFPHTARAYDTTFNGGVRVILYGLGLDYLNGSDIIITRMSANGDNLIASTYLGGSANDGLNIATPLKINYADEIRGEIQIDENDNVYIGSSTFSADFPTTTSAFQTTYNGRQEGCLVKLDNNLSTLIYSSFIGGAQDDAVYSVEIDKAKDLFFTGGTGSSDFPLAGSSYRTFYGGGRSDGYVAKLNATGSALLNATYIGSNEYDQSYFVRLNRSEEVFLFGQTMALADSFIFNAGYFHLGGGQFISKLKNNLDTLVWSTAFGTGGKVDISPTAFLVDVCNKVYLAGWGGDVNILYSGSSGVPFGGTSGLDTTSDAIQSVTDNSDFYLLVIEDDASAISFGSYYGGLLSEDHVDGGTSRFDRNGIIYQSVCASCDGHQDFPIYPHPDSVASSVNNSFNCNNAVFKIDFNLPIILANFEATPLLCAPANVNFIDNSRTFPTTIYEWSFGDGATSNVRSPSHTYTSFGTYQVRLIVRDVNACNLADTAYQDIFVLQNGKDTLVSLRICDTQTLQIGFPSILDTGVTYNWTPSTNLNFNNIANPIADITGNQTYICYISIAGCIDTFTQVIEIDSVELSLLGDSIACPFDTVRLNAINLNPADVLTYNWDPSTNIVGSNTGSSVAAFTTDSTIFTVMATNATGCVGEASASLYTRLSIPRIIADFTYPPSKCIPLNVPFTNQSTEQGSSGFQWSFGDGTFSSALNPTHNFTDTGTFIIRLIQNYSTLCIIADTTYDTLHLRYPIRDTLQTFIICDSQQIEIGYSSNDTSVYYDWFPSIYLNNDTISNPIARPLNSTWYTCAVSDDNCADTLYQLVAISRVAILAHDTLINCPTLPTHLFVQNLNNTDTLTYEWFPTTNIISGSSTNSPLVYTNDSSLFYVIATNQYGCQAIDTVILKTISDGVTVDAQANIDTAEYLEQIQLTAIASDPVTYNWMPPSLVSNVSIANPTAIIQLTSTFIVEVIDSLGCKDYDTVIVYRKALKCGQSAIFIPNAFSPNSDGNNDIFYVRGKNLQSFYLAIFDRWGEKVFESTDINIGWDGTYKGKKIDPSVCGYIFEGECESGEAIKDKGNITIIR